MIKTNCWYCSKEYEMGAVIHTCTEPFINKNHKYGHCPCDGCKDYTERKDMFISKWIPCSERLPEDEGRFLVTMETYIFNEYSHPIGTSFYSPSYGWVNASPNKVLAWMPLPEPWKGADDDTD